MTQCYQIHLTQEFKDWLKIQNAKFQYQIDARIMKIREVGYFGDRKNISFYEKSELKNVIWELRFNNGIRIYYAYIPEQKILLLLGGNKNGQEKDINKAKKIFAKSTE